MMIFHLCLLCGSTSEFMQNVSFHPPWRNARQPKIGALLLVASSIATIDEAGIRSPPSPESWTTDQGKFSSAFTAQYACFVKYFLMTKKLQQIKKLSYVTPVRAQWLTIWQPVIPCPAPHSIDFSRSRVRQSNYAN